MTQISSSYVALVISLPQCVICVKNDSFEPQVRTTENELKIQLELDQTLKTINHIKRTLCKKIIVHKLMIDVHISTFELINCLYLAIFCCLVQERAVAVSTR